MSISSMISNFKKLNFCNFFPHFPLLVRPCVFPIQMASSHTASPIKILCISPIHLLFQGGSFAATFPPAILPHSPRFLSLSEYPTGRIYTKNQTVPFKIEAFPGRIITCTGQEWGAFQGGFQSILARRISLARGCLGVRLGRILVTLPPKNPPEREKIGGRRGGKMGTKKGPQRFATSPSQGVIIREILCAS